jgi:hypothetical protein
LRAEVLKIGHHGSKNSTTSEFLAAVRPRLAIISVGADNPYGHPNAELLERLANANVRVLRTDRDGAVHILMNGNGLKVTCFVPCLPVLLAAYNACKRQRTTKTTSSNKNPNAARYSRFFWYCANENGAATPDATFAGVSRGKNKGTLRAYSWNASP